MPAPNIPPNSRASGAPLSPLAWYGARFTGPLYRIRLMPAPNIPPNSRASGAPPLPLWERGPGGEGCPPAPASKDPRALQLTATKPCRYSLAEFWGPLEALAPNQEQLPARSPANLRYNTCLIVPSDCDLRCH